MIAKKCTNDDLQQALDLVNARYQGNVKFNNFTPKGKNIVFTLRVKDSKEPGAGISHSGRRSVAACWHVHGHYFECLFSINPKAEVYSSKSGWITISGGNWQDFEIGSMMEPLRMSQACDCNKGAQQNIERLIPGRVAFKTLTQSQIKTCPICSFDPAHYETPYGCLCKDPNAQDQKKTERIERRKKMMAAIKRQQKNRASMRKRIITEVLGG